MLKKMNDADFEQFYQLLSDNFPKSEIRTKEGQRKLLPLDDYCIYVEKSDGDIVGFLAEWSGEHHRFLEHLAVDEKFRGGGTGSHLLREYHDLNDKPVILEVEQPHDDTGYRRVKFYEKNGYTLNEFGYIQPPLFKDKTGVPLVLMSYPEALTGDGFDAFKEWVFKTVYDKSIR